MTLQCRKKADEYLGHFVGHEGSGSLLSALKARGWASELSAGVSEQSSVVWLFEITITLTEAGLAAGPGEQALRGALLGHWGDWRLGRVWYRPAAEQCGILLGSLLASMMADGPACCSPPFTCLLLPAGCGLACAGLLFEYLGMLRAAGPQRWAFDELATIAQMRFRFQVGVHGLHCAAGC